MLIINFSLLNNSLKVIKYYFSLLYYSIFVSNFLSTTFNFYFSIWAFHLFSFSVTLIWDHQPRMATASSRTSSFSRNFSSPSVSASYSQQARGVKRGSNGAAFVSSGILDLDGRFLLLSPSHFSFIYSFPNCAMFYRYFGRWISSWKSCGHNWRPWGTPPPSFAQKFHVPRACPSPTSVLCQSIEGS